MTSIQRASVLFLTVAAVSVVVRAQAAGVPVIAVAGRCLLSPAQLRSAGFTAAYSLSVSREEISIFQSGKS